MKTPFTTVVATGFILSVLPASAQTSQIAPPGLAVGETRDQGMAIDPGEDAGIAMNVDAGTFVPMVFSTNRLELASSHLALERAEDRRLREFAAMMIADHRDIGDRFADVVRRAGLPVPQPEAEMMGRHQEMLDAVENNDESFDVAYVRLQQQLHQEAVRLFSAYAQSGDEPDIVLVAQEMLPRLKQHLAAVRELPGATVDATGSVVNTDLDDIPENEHGLGANTGNLGEPQ